MTASRSTFNTKLEELFGVDLRSLALFRIVLAGLILFDLASRVRFIEATHTDAGVLPGTLFEPLQSYISLHFISGGYAFQCVFMALAFCAASMLLVGYRTRLATFAIWLLLIALHARNYYMMDGGDSLIRALLFWSLFLPLGARFSLDARHGRGRGPAGGRNMLLSAATVGLLVQFVCVYVSAGLSKSGPEWHETGTAIEMVLGQGYWARPLGTFLSGYPELLRVLTPVVVYFEIVGPLLLFVPFYTGPIRLWVIAAFWAFQFGLATSIQLNLFPWINTAATLPFLPSLFWDRFAPSRLRTLAAREAEVGTVPPEPQQSGWRRSLRWIQQGVLLSIAGYLLMAAASSPGKLSRGIVENLGRVGGVIPYWNMYMHGPEYDFSFEAIAKLNDGTPVDLLQARAGDGWQHVRLAHEQYRFRYYLEKIGVSGKAGLTRAYLLWLCRSWNLEQPPHHRAETLALVKVRKRILPAGSPERVPVLGVACERTESE